MYHIASSLHCDREEPASGAEEHNKNSFPFNKSTTASSSNRAGSAPQPLHDASFVYLGRARSHTAPITGIAFGMKDGQETLISIAEDQ